MILKSKPWAAAEHGLMKRRVVLRALDGLTTSGPDVEFVTHIQTEDEQGRLAYYGGHYHADDLRAALDDFEGRTA